MGYVGALKWLCNNIVLLTKRVQTNYLGLIFRASGSKWRCTPFSFRVVFFIALRNSSKGIGLKELQVVRQGCSSYLSLRDVSKEKTTYLYIWGLRKITVQHMRHDKTRVGLDPGPGQNYQHLYHPVFSCLLVPAWVCFSAVSFCSSRRAALSCLTMPSKTGCIERTFSLLVI